MYEYTYLFKWLAHKNVPYDPSNHSMSNTVYLIVPNKGDEKVKYFINYRTPDTTFTTERSWKMEFNTILKRTKEME
jgi:hypoxanthine phosphoribosyltransferase